MKIVLVMLTAVTLGSCYSSRLEEVEMVDARLVRIVRSSYETYHNQYTWHQAQQLTWEDSYNKQDVSFVTNACIKRKIRFRLLRT